jgi:hypothetical protein
MTWIACSMAAVAAAVPRTGVEHHKVVQGAVVTDGCGAYAGFGELAGVGLALVAQDGWVIHRA